MRIVQRRKILAVAAVILLGLHETSHAIDSGSIEFAAGNRIQVVRVGAQWDWQRQWWRFNETHIGGYWDFSVGRWRENRFRNVVGDTENIFDISLTPVFRLQRNSKTGLYAETGIGLHYLPSSYNNNGRQLSDNLQFGSHIGAGYVFGNRLDIGLSIQHMSNGGIRKPNDGVNFAVARASYRF